MKRRILALLLCACIGTTSVPVEAFAQEVRSENEELTNEVGIKEVTEIISEVSESKEAEIEEIELEVTATEDSVFEMTEGVEETELPTDVEIEEMLQTETPERDIKETKIENTETIATEILVEEPSEIDKAETAEFEVLETETVEIDAIGSQIQENEILGLEAEMVEYEEVETIPQFTNDVFYTQKFEELGIKVSVVAEALSVPEGAKINIKLEKQKLTAQLENAVLQNAEQKIEQKSQIPVLEERSIFNMYSNLEASVSETYAVKVEITYTDDNGEDCIFIPENTEDIQITIQQLVQEQESLDELKEVEIVSLNDAKIEIRDEISTFQMCQETDAEISANTVVLVQYAATADSPMVAAQEKAWNIINNYADPEYFMNDPYKNDMTEAEYNELKQAAINATAGCTAQYEKIKAITGFIADRIYYDYYYLEGDGDTCFINPYDVYTQKRTVCSGYARLMRTLLVSIGIPCMILRGDNHEYNATYDSDNQKWIFVDATWCSSNSYTIDKEWIYYGYSFSEFDLSPTQIAKLSNHEVYYVDGLLDGVHNSTYYTLTSDHDNDGYYNDMTWSECNWHLEFRGARQSRIMVLGGFAGFELGNVIQARDFFYSSELQEIDLSETRITEIGAWVFGGCEKLSKVKLPSTLETIGNGAFSGCKILQEVDMSEMQITEISEWAFDDCEKLSKVKLPSTLETIGNGAFFGCKILQEVDMSATQITEIGESAFENCEKLSKVKLPSTLRRIGGDAFRDCKKVQEIDMSETQITEIGNYVFAGCNELQEIDMSATQITEIGARAFWSCKKLSKVKFSPTLKVIGDYAFYGSNNPSLEKIDLSMTQVSEIGESAFESLKIAEVSFPKTLKVIGDYAFSSCGYLRYIRLPGTSLQTIGSEAFGWGGDVRFVITDLSEEKLDCNNVGIWGNCEVRVCSFIYDVAFNGNGATGGTMDNETCSGDEKYELPANKFTRTNYKFVEWNTKKDGSGKAYKDCASVKNLTKKDGETVILYAQWKKDGYSITYKLNGGKNNSNNPSSYKTTSETIKLKNPTRKGYTFKGWYSDSKFKNKATQIKKGSKGNKTFYAKWSANKYSITYKLNGGTNNSKNPANYKITTKTIKLENPTREGYKFEGWYTDSKYKNKITTIKKGSTKKYSLYAKWSKIKVNTTKITSAKNNKSKQIAVKYKKVSGAKGYEISYSTSKDFKKNVEKKTSTSTTYKIEELKKGKNYYVRVRAYKVDSAGKKVYGKYTDKKKVKVSK